MKKILRKFIVFVKKMWHSLTCINGRHHCSKCSILAYLDLVGKNWKMAVSCKKNNTEFFRLIMLLQRWQKTKMTNNLNTCCQQSAEWLPISSPILSMTSMLSACAACRRGSFGFVCSTAGIFSIERCPSSRFVSSCSITQEAFASWAKTLPQRSWSPVRVSVIINIDK